MFPMACPLRPRPPPLQRSPPRDPHGPKSDDAHIGGEIGRSEKDAINALDCGDLANSRKGLTGFDLDEDAGFLLYPGDVILDPAIPVAALGKRYAAVRHQRPWDRLG